MVDANELAADIEIAAGAAPLRVDAAPVAELARTACAASEAVGAGVDEGAAKPPRDASENAFNTAFKRVMGCPPRRYARTNATSRQIDEELR